MSAAAQALARIRRANAATERRPSRPAYLDLEEANRRDARTAGELASPPATTSTGHHGTPWAAPSNGDSA